MSEQIANTPIRFRSYASRGIANSKMQSSPNVVMQSDGTLWAAIAVSTLHIHVLRSQDNGFSWEEVHEIVLSGYDLRTDTGTAFNGPLVTIAIDEIWRNLDIIFATWEDVGDDYGIGRIRYDLDDDTDTGTETTIITTTPGSTDIYDGCYQFSYNNNEGYLVYADLATNSINLRLISPRTTGVSGKANFTDTSIGAIFGIQATEDGLCHIIYMPQIGGTKRVRHTCFDESAVTFNSAVELEDIGDHSLYNPVVAVDGYGTVCTVYDDNNDTSVDIKYSYCLNSGTGTWTDWSTPTTIPMTSGHGDFVDSLTSKAEGRPDIIASSEGGFLISYIRDDSDSIPRCFVRELSTSDGSTYTLGNEAEIGTNNYSGEDILGAKFFHPIAIEKLDLSNVGLARIAFSIGIGDDAEGLDDTQPVVIAQERLSEGAFTSTLASLSSSYTIESGDSTNIVVTFNNLGGPSENVDFYSEGMTGNFTTRYIAGFNRLGTAARFLQYEPSADSYMDDISAYGDPTESSGLVVVQPQSYQFPVPQLSPSDFTDWIERDVRKIFLPPTKHLSRTFVVNKGGHLKRTVWTMDFDGNRYELSQVVPYFINNQIAFYSANAYVIGPSHDPFSRTILSSET